MQWKSQNQAIKSDIDLGYGVGIWTWNTDLEYGINGSSLELYVTGQAAGLMSIAARCGIPGHT